MRQVEVTTVVEHVGSAMFVCIPLEKVLPWKLDGTTTVEGTIERLDPRIWPNYSLLENA